jgi:MbtH protein
MPEEQEDTRTYVAFVNAEEDYSIWLADRELPDGWRADMRPESLRERMGGFR